MFAGGGAMQFTAIHEMFPRVCSSFGGYNHHDTSSMEFQVWRVHVAPVSNSRTFVLVVFFLSKSLQAGAHQKKELHPCLEKAYQFLKFTQIPDNPPNYKKYYRQMNKVHFQCKHFLGNGGMGMGLFFYILINEFYC